MSSPRWYLVTEHQHDSQVPVDLHKIGVFGTQREAIAQADKHTARLRSTTGFQVAMLEGSGGTAYKVETPKRVYLLKVVRDDYLLNKRLWVESSMISRIAYNTKKKSLYIRFKQSDALWRYDCSSEVFFQLASAKSVGQIYNAVVKGKYMGEQVG